MQKNALTEGAIREIFLLFIRPLIRFKPENTGLKQYIEALFHVGTRDIIRYRARAAFEMPGLLYITANAKVQGLGVRPAAEKQIMWVRTDKTQPERVDIEWNGAGKQQIFCLNESEWNFVKLHLDKAE